MSVPFQQSGVAHAPYDFEQRLVRVLPETDKLEVMVPEKHDLVLMKTVRGYEHDLQTIEEIHQHAPLSLNLLVERYEQEMRVAVIGPLRLRGNFLALVERLFPHDVKQVEQRLRRGTPHTTP